MINQIEHPEFYSELSNAADENLYPRFHKEAEREGEEELSPHPLPILAHCRPQGQGCPWASYFPSCPPAAMSCNSSWKQSLREYYGSKSGGLPSSWCIPSCCTSSTNRNCNTCSTRSGTEASERTPQWSCRHEDKTPQILFLLDIHVYYPPLPHLHPVLVCFVK